MGGLDSFFVSLAIGVLFAYAICAIIIRHRIIKDEGCKGCNRYEQCSLRKLMLYRLSRADNIKRNTNFKESIKMFKQFIYKNSIYKPYMYLYSEKYGKMKINKFLETRRPENWLSIMFDEQFFWSDYFANFGTFLPKKVMYRETMKGKLQLNNDKWLNKLKQKDKYAKRRIEKGILGDY